MRQIVKLAVGGSVASVDLRDPTHIGFQLRKASLGLIAGHDTLRSTGRCLDELVFTHHLPNLEEGVHGTGVAGRLLKRIDDALLAAELQPRLTDDESFGFLDS